MRVTVLFTIAGIFIRRRSFVLMRVMVMSFMLMVMTCAHLMGMLDFHNHGRSQNVSERNRDDQEGLEKNAHGLIASVLGRNFLPTWATP